MRILFICNQARHRSPTAAKLFSAKYETKYAGLYNEPSVTQKELDWADVIAVMEDEQRIEISKRFPRTYLTKQIVTMHISDAYAAGSPELIQALQQKADLLEPLAKL